MPLVIAETLRIPGARCVLSDAMPAVSLMKLVMASGTMALLPLLLPDVMGLPPRAVNGPPLPTLPRRE